MPPSHPLMLRAQYYAVAVVLECGWIKGLGRLFLQLLPLVLPLNT